MTLTAAVLLLAQAVPAVMPDTESAPEAPNFNRDVAPLLHSHCAPCHRPGESAPFSLLTYTDAAKRASQLVEVTGSGFMPPWLPEPGAYRFEGDRRLSAAQVSMLARWASSGSTEGAPGDHVPPPEWPQGWALGEPDLVLELPAESAGYELGADGQDEFRNLVFPSSLDETRYVRALELRPGNPAVHHAIVQVDQSPSCEVLASVDAAPGFPGMSMGDSQPPDGHFIGWTPGKQPRITAPDMAWRLLPGADLVVQLHLSKTGKPERVRPRLGLYFTDQAPTRFPYSVVLYREDIDIPPGVRNHTVRDEYRLPTDVQALAIYPHAHYLGRSMRATVLRPDGSREELLRIDDWDFNWQDEYTFAEPVLLPEGALLTMEWVYDNSTSNVRNPNVPPERVTFGESSADEMGTLTLEVLPLQPGGRLRLEEARWAEVVARRPYDWDAHNRLGALAIEREDFEEAAGHIDSALAYNPEYPDALANGGLLLLRQGRAEPALEFFEQALRLEPAHPGANAQLGVALRILDRGAEARAHFEAALERWPHLAEARFEYANLLALAGEPRPAIEHYLAVLRLRPALPEAHNNLANTYFGLGELDRALEEYEQAVALRPDYFNAHLNRGRCLVAAGLPARAIPSLRTATRLRPADALAAASLREALAEEE